jgi:glutamate 5-kinase
MGNRIVVKIGSSSLTSANGGLNREQIAFFSRELATVKQAGHEVILVTSGAVAAGFGMLGYVTRPKEVHEKQASAAVGQALLMQAYQEALASHELVSGQLLLTRGDFASRRRTQYASMTLETLITRGAIPIINENDSVSVDELKFGDNDLLSALVAQLVEADQLVILTDMDGLYTADPRKDTSATRIETVDVISEELMEMAGGAGSAVGTGGMRSKLIAAKTATACGIEVFVGRVTSRGELILSVNGQGQGTIFRRTEQPASRKKQWVGFLSTPRGKVQIDAGAVTALLSNGRSLLPAGVRKVEGHFVAGDVVEVTDPDGFVVGRGICNYNHELLRNTCGQSSEAVRANWPGQRVEVVHRDDWMPMEGAY